MELKNGDGTTGIILGSPGNVIAGDPLACVAGGDTPYAQNLLASFGITGTVAALTSAYQAWQGGSAPKPVPRRCVGSLAMNSYFGEPMPVGKCDNGLTWAAYCFRHTQLWSDAGMTAPLNSYMHMTRPGGVYQISTDSMGTWKLHRFEYDRVQPLQVRRYGEQRKHRLSGRRSAALRLLKIRIS